MKTTAKDLRFRTREILDSVARGEEVIITYRGKPCAKVIPYKEGSSKVSEPHSLYGIWEDHDDIADVEEYVREIRKGRNN
ncbi:MAG: type II toxin-antitoxin system Phd/YefM family antitoxin [Spirochaetota bacterium]